MRSVRVERWHECVSVSVCEGEGERGGRWHVCESVSVSGPEIGQRRVRAGGGG